MIAKPISPMLQRQKPVTNGLALGLPFTEGSGTTVYDQSGNGNNGTLSGGVTWAGGPSGWTLNFNGSTGYVTYPLAKAAPALSKFTLMTWFGCNALTGTYQMIISVTTTGNPTELRLLGNTTRLELSMGSTGDLILAGSLSLKTWYHLTAPYDGTNILLYVNGALQGSGTYTGAISNTTNPCVIGGRAGSFFVNGMIDTPKIYTRALSPAEIAADYFDSAAIYRRKSLLRRIA